MTYTTSGFSGFVVSGSEEGYAIRALTTATGYVQCYISGMLIGWQAPVNGAVSFRVSGLSGTDSILLVAVDTANASTDYWDDAYDGPANRLVLKVPQLASGYGPADLLRIYRGDAGDASAETLVHEQLYRPGGVPLVGFGAVFGDGFGIDGTGMPGFGRNFGAGEFGLDCTMIEWRSEPLPAGTYPVKVTIVDGAGNESTAYETTQALVSYARPAADLTVTDFTADVATFSFTESPDVSA